MPGQEMYSFMERLFPIYRSLIGEGVRETLTLINEKLPDMKIKGIQSGKAVFDWIVPNEWKVNEAYIQDLETNEKLVDFTNNNLHLVCYSDPCDFTTSISNIEQKLHSLPECPEWIPYITNYYNSGWGFCLSDNERSKLLSRPDRQVRVKIDSQFRAGELNYGELVIRGDSKQEILISTYICHPSLANNELSGPVVATFIAKYLLTLKLKYTYRILFVPETIGAIAYISENLEHLKAHVIGGFVLTCIGDDNSHSFLKSKFENSISDRAAICAYNSLNIQPLVYDFNERGSDERQYNSPGVGLPISSIMRTKYGEYKEYHTSADNMQYVSASGLSGGYNVVKRTIDIIENNKTFMTTTICEPHMSKYDLYPRLSTHQSHNKVKSMMDVLAYSDGDHDLISLSNKINIAFDELSSICQVLENKGLIRQV